MKKSELRALILNSNKERLKHPLEMMEDLSEGESFQILKYFGKDCWFYRVRENNLTGTLYKEHYKVDKREAAIIGLLLNSSVEGISKEYFEDTIQNMEKYINGEKEKETVQS